MFLEHANNSLPTITQIIKTMHDTASQNMQQLWALPVQYMQTASITTAPNATGSPNSQLAIALMPITMDPTTTQWATACYGIYHMCP